MEYFISFVILFVIVAVLTITSGFIMDTFDVHYLGDAFFISFVSWAIIVLLTLAIHALVFSENVQIE